MVVQLIVTSIYAVVLVAVALLSGKWQLFFDAPSIVAIVLLGFGGVAAKCRSVKFENILDHSYFFILAGLFGTLVTVVTGLPEVTSFGQFGAVLSVSMLSSLYGVAIYLILKVVK